MTIQLRSADDIAKMREAGRLAAEVLELIGEYVVPGVSTEELDRICHDHIVMCKKPYPPVSATVDFPNRCAPRSITWSVTAFPRRKKYLRAATLSILMSR